MTETAFYIKEHILFLIVEHEIRYIKNMRQNLNDRNMKYLNYVQLWSKWYTYYSTPEGPANDAKKTVEYVCNA